MSELPESVWKGLFWLLLIVLIAVYVLSGHANDALRAQVAVTEAEIATLPERLAEADQAVATLRDALDVERAALRAVRAEAQAQAAAPDDCEQRLGETEQALAAARADPEPRVPARQASAELRGYYSSLAALGAQLTDDGVRLNLTGDALRFPSGAATLPAGELPALERIADLLRTYPRLSARIEGHTDSSGSAPLNRRLSGQRAAAVRDWFMQQGIAEDRLSARGLGADRPVADNATAAGREVNRRVEVWLIEPADG